MILLGRPVRHAHGERRGERRPVVRPGELDGLDIHPTQWRQLRDWLDGTYPHLD